MPEDPPSGRDADVEDEEERGGTGGPLRRALRIVLPLGVIAGGLALVWLLVATAPEPARELLPSEGALVEVVSVRLASEAPRVEANGIVRAARQVELVPQVSGNVVWISQKLVPGGHFVEGEPLLRLDRAEYELAIAEQRARIADAQLALTRERAEAVVEERTRALFPEDTIQPSPEGRELAQRRPQLEAARRQREAAQSLLERAELDLSRTTIRSPCECTVASESVDVGQRVSPPEAVATLVGTDAYHVEVAVPVDTISAIRASASSGAAGSRARVTMSLQGEEHAWDGHVARLLPAVTERGAMAQLLVVVPDPLHAETTGVPLLLDSFVRVSIEAEPIDGAVIVPRAALREGRRVWIASDAAELEAREVDVVWRTEDAVLVASGVRPGERVIVNRLAAPVEGMRVRVAREMADATEPLAEAREP